ncbi:MAG: hypothetical protein ACYSR6_03555 [Planctomycetota bacterium]
MKKVSVYTIVLFCAAVVLVGSSNSQVPYVAVYFDPALQQMAANCPAAPLGTVADTLYIVAHGFDMQMSAIEYQVNYPNEILYIADIVDPSHASTGTSESGITINFSPPVNAYTPVVVQQVFVFWFCDYCGGSISIPLVVQPHPTSGVVSAVRSSDGAIIEAIGMTSLICPHVPVENTTWGRIKSLYH